MTTRATRSPRRRTVVALAVVFAVLAAFVVRLVDIQVVNASAHVADSMSVGKLGLTRTIAGERGSIIDQNGVAMARSVLVYDAQLDPSLIELLETDEANPPTMPWAEASERIATIVGMDAQTIRDMVADELAANPHSQYLPLKRGLGTDQYVALRDLDLPYLASISRGTRIYPNGAVGGNIVGFVGSDGQALAGLELAQNECLSPTDGQEAYLRGANGMVIPGSQQTTPAQNGGTLQLTINSDLNWYLQQMIAEEAQALGAIGGTVIVVEVKTGKIRAAAEWPIVDPNDVAASDPEDRGSRLFTTTFEPGSTFKAITAAAVMEAGGLTALSTVTAADREVFPNGAVVNDAMRHGPVTYTLAGALIDSSNVALSKFGTMVSADVRHEFLERFGVGERTAVGFPGEEPGVLHPVEDWDNQSLYTTTFGQYFTVTTPQVAGAYQAIANGGVRMPLSIVESCTFADGEIVTPELPEPVEVMSESNANELARMIENVAVQGGLSDVITVPGYRIAGKTGTAEKPDLVNGGYKPGVYYTSLAGFAPVDDPQYVVVVTLDEPTRVTSSAATAAAFQKAMTQVLKTYRVMPSSAPMEPLLPKYN